MLTDGTLFHHFTDTTRVALAHLSSAYHTQCGLSIVVSLVIVVALATTVTGR